MSFKNHIVSFLFAEFLSALYKNIQKDASSLFGVSLSNIFSHSGLSFSWHYLSQSRKLWFWILNTNLEVSYFNFMQEATAFSFLMSQGYEKEGKEQSRAGTATSW